MARTPKTKNRFQPQATDLRKSDARRKAIVDATIQSIAEDGVQQLSAFAIGKRTKMRRSHIAYYFPNLDKMIEAAILQVVETGQRFTIAAMEKAHTPPDRLDAWVEGTLTWMESEPSHRSVMLLLQYLALVQPYYQVLQSNIAETGEDRIAAILLAKLGEKKNKADAIKASHLARVIRSYLVGELTRFYTTPGPHDATTFRKTLKNQIRDLAQGLWAR